ncbi:family 78 glycoside hydrolase catalytic domain [Puniceicoccus vermicola]|uniref:alpha-L-rhamnosidase n=1 Tax=Puniceicoccus vermicola TaxID=388746 RepID=A0A7X1E528_9BACT|nr:family 78 glycoside hydrolase catalytic domain [Puniceicoccus vermicola]
MIAHAKSLVVEETPPDHRCRLPDNGWFFDFGKAAFGTVRLRVKASRGTNLTLHLGEKLNPNGRVDRQPPGTVRYRAIPLKIAKGCHVEQIVIPADPRNTGPAAILMPAELFEVLPFRYAEVEPEEGPALLSCELIRLEVSYPFDESASDFRCDDDALNRVWDLCKYSIKATSFCGIYVDGDRERIPYEGDAYINQLCHYGVDAEYEMARRTIEYLIDHPTWPTDWALHFLPMAWADYLYTGRNDLLRHYYEELKTKALFELAREDGIISTETGLVTPELLARLHLVGEPPPLRDLVDWPPGSFADSGIGERDGYDMVPVKSLINAFYLWNLWLLAQVAEMLGLGGEAVEIRERYEQVKIRYQQLFFDSRRGVFLDGEDTDHASLHANMLPAALGLIPPGYEVSVLDFLRSRGMACSVYGAQYLLEACYQLGAADDALDLMTATHDRGWLNMVKSGSTITMEAWDHPYKNNLDWNHAWGAAPANIIPRFLVGARPLQPGFRKALIAPQPGRLRQIRSTVPTIRGPIRIELSASASKDWTLRIDSPVPSQLDLSGLCSHDRSPRDSYLELPAGTKEIKPTC